MAMKLQGRTAIVTGGSRGIGYSIAKRFLEHGATVVISARSSDALNNAQSELRRVSPTIYTQSMDVSEPSEVDAFFKWFEDSFSNPSRSLPSNAVKGSRARLDILVNCAGIQKPIGKSWEVKAEEWLYTVKVNLFGTYLMIKKATPMMIRENYGKIINFSGGGATSPRPNFSAYAASKTAVVRLTETLAHELKGYNIYVNAIAPGAVNTRMLEEVLEAGEDAGEKEYKDAQKRLKEGGTPPEVAADLALFLASKESDGITGRLISAQWDDWLSFPNEKEMIEKSSLYTLRRIDNKYFRKVESD